MRTTIDKAGRVVVPKAIREAVRLGPGTEIVIRVRGGVVEIEPAPREVDLERRGRFEVAVPRKPGPKLSGGVVEDTRREVSEELR
mgnify:CR=1 FL=1